MENSLQNMISVDVAADGSSLDSLSFAGLLCIQDQQWKSASTDTANQIHREPEFEFSQSRPTSKTGTAPKNDPPSNLFISSGQLLPQTFLSQSKQHYVINQQHYRGSVPATGIISKRSSSKTGDNEVSDRQYQEQRNQVIKEHTASKSWFGRKVFKSFVSPCRECQSADSTVKAHKLQEENVKLN